MAIGMYFAPTGMSAEKFEEVHRRLDAAGAAEPEGRTSHTAFDTGNGIHVFDVWDSDETFQAFGQTLMPILEELGIDVGEPTGGLVVRQQQH